MALEVDRPNLPPAPAEVAAPAPSRTEPASAPFAEVLASLGARVDQGEGLILGVVRSEWSSSDPGTLIALQAGIYRYSEVVDLAGKLVDRASNAVRTVLQSGH